jgi:hypothetical protein
MSRIIALAPQRKAVLGALDRVAESPVFHSSKRGREFLRHIVERALAGEFEQLKERCIGSALFGRPGDYDTGSDSVVRVTANDVRKRLAAYYDAAGNAEPVTFELPVGSYIPEIHLAPTLDRPPAAPVEPLAAPVVARSRWSAIAGWLVAAVLGLVLLRGWMLKPESPQSRAIATLPWLAMFDGGKTPRLILADSSMGALRELHPFPASVEDYANRKFLTPPTGLRPDLTGVWNSIATRRHTSMASARVAAEFSPLALAAGRSPVILGAREVNLGDFHRGENFILVGGSSSTPWVELFEDQMDFVFRFEPGKGTRVEIRHPHAGDPSDLLSYVPTGTTGQAYATLSLLRGLDGRGRVLVIQGTNMEGTDLAAGLALNTEAMESRMRGCGLDPTKASGSFEILLKLNATAGSVSSSTVIATHCTL